MRIKKREEDAADKWLRKNDPYYTAKGKAKELQYPYLTPDQEVRRRRTEIPISAIAGRIENSTGDIRDDADLMDYLDLITEMFSCG